MLPNYKQYQKVLLVIDMYYDGHLSVDGTVKILDSVIESNDASDKLRSIAKKFKYTLEIQ